jgi:RNA polymerase sigma-70 factor (ECF subfamily)
MAMAIPDAQLVARCRGGDHEAWRELVDRFARYVYAIVNAYGLRHQDAEDAFQDVFAKAYERLGSLRDDKAVRPWLAQMTRRCCVDRLRAGAREQTVEPGDELGVGDDLVAALDEAFAVREALRELPEHCREVLDRFFARDQSYRTIGEALDVPAGTIASRISRCLARLRGALEENTRDVRLEDR